MVYNMNKAKKAARLAARAAQLGMSVEEMESGGGGAAAASGGGGGGGGRPGGLVRLGWKLGKKGAKGAKDEDRRNMAMEVKGIEMYLKRDLDIDVDSKKDAGAEKKTAGMAASKPSLLQIANSADHKSNIGRVGGERGENIAVAASHARRSLAAAKDLQPDKYGVKNSGGEGGGGEGGGD